VKTPPPDLNPDLIADALATHWGQRIRVLEYAPLGFGSHHWTAEAEAGERWFITVDDLLAEHLLPDADASFRRLESAFGVAHRLRIQCGLSFVVAPVPSESCRLVHRLSNRYAMATFTHLDVKSSDFGIFTNEEDRIGALRLVGQVHSASQHISTDDLRRDTLEIPGRKAFEATLTDVDKPWIGGPYAEPARKLLRDHASAVHSTLERFDDLVRDVSSDPSRWVITHGEPHAGNILRTSQGPQVIVDWDTVGFAPPERDLRMLVDEEHSDWSAYREITGMEAISDHAIKAYQLHWDLSEIAIYLAWCRAPHENTEEMRIAWRELGKYLRMTG
jgi:spectinomycin phosphotransferase